MRRERVGRRVDRRKLAEARGKAARFLTRFYFPLLSFYLEAREAGFKVSVELMARPGSCASRLSPGGGDPIFGSPRLTFPGTNYEFW